MTTVYIKGREGYEKVVRKAIRNSKLDEGDHISSTVSKYHYNLTEILYSFTKKYKLDIKNVKVNTHKRKKNCCWEIIAVLEEYLKVRDKFNILEYIYLNRIPPEYLKVIVKTIKLTKLNNNLYK